jgi:hypothetical protein
VVREKTDERITRINLYERDTLVVSYYRREGDELLFRLNINPAALLEIAKTSDPKDNK